MNLGKELRLTRRRDFTEVFNTGKRLAGEHLYIYYLSGKESRRFACIVSGKVGKPTVRNRIKRALKEEYRLNLENIPDDTWIIVRMKYPKEKYSKVTRNFLKTLRASFKEILQQITKHGGVEHKFTGILYSLFTLPINLFRWIISPLLPPSCIFIPTCSQYALQAISIHGPIKGTGKALYRVLRCNPWNKGGYDPP